MDPRQVPWWVETACPDSRDLDKSGLETAPTNLECLINSKIYHSIKIQAAIY